MTTVPKNLYIDKLNNIVDKYNNIYHRTFKMKPVDVNSGNYIERNVNSNNKDPKFQVGHQVRISKYRYIFAKVYTPNWSKEVFVINEVKNTVPWTYVISDRNGEKIIGTFYEKELE